MTVPEEMGTVIGVFRFEKVIGPVIAGLSWGILACALTWLRNERGVLLVVWLPSAVAVAALFATPTRRWPVLLATLALFQFATMSLALGISAKTALALTFSNQVEALICTSLGIRVLGKRGKTPQSFTHVVGLFGSAVLGCAVSATIAFMFFESIGLTEMLRWFLASVLGVIAASPVFLCLRQWLGIGDQSVRFTQGEGKSGFPLAVAAMFGIGIIVLSMAHLALVPLLFVAVVFAVIRYGQLAAAFGVLAYTAAALLINLATGNPAAALGEDPSASGLVLQVQMLLMLATALPIAAMLLRHGDLAQKLRDQNEELHDNLTILNLAEQLAGLGRWHLDLQTGQQVWSPQMLALNGLPRELAPDPGDICGMLPDGGKRLMSELEAHRDDRRPYSFEYSVLPPNGDERTLRMHVTNEFDDAGVRVALFAVAMDVTEQVRREAALREARERAIGLAAEAQKLALTDTLTGLANRRATLDWLSRMVRASAQVGEPLAVLMFDVDFFKRINDCFGHQTGDEVLKHVAALARSQVRSEDMVGRVGGEEFVCILSGLEQAEARALAERLRHAIAEGSEREGLPRTTVSVGLALARPGDTPESLLARADMALYEAKEAGRNQVRRAA